MGADIIGRR
ncbi:unnamed protein product, partial [Rotaria sordida]